MEGGGVGFREVSEIRCTVHCTSYCRKLRVSAVLWCINTPRRCLLTKSIFSGSMFRFYSGVELIVSTKTIDECLKCCQKYK